jgi:hypothetical protein
LVAFQVLKSVNFRVVTDVGCAQRSGISKTDWREFVLGYV